MLKQLRLNLRSFLRFTDEFADAQKKLKKLIHIVEERLSDTPLQLRLTYSDTIKYFVDCRPEHPDIVQGAILLFREQLPINTFWVFLDATNAVVCDNHGVPYGRKMIILALDKELEEAFSGTDLLIFQ